MTTWLEVRTAALVGTGRRPLPQTGPLGTVIDEATPPELRALEAAALLGVQRRAGLVASSAVPPAPIEAEGQPAVEVFAPQGAVQLLELLLAGNLGKLASVGPLVEHWFESCARAGRIVPHHLLVPVLGRASFSSDLQALVRPILGRRGIWLSAQRKVWTWAVPPSALPVSSDGVEVLNIEAFLLLGSNERSQILGQLRLRDPEAGRGLLDEAFRRLDAASRAELLGHLSEGLTAADEPTLEAALDDRSKAVRNVAIDLLNGLGDCDRSRRLTSQLEPLVQYGGRLRPTLTVSYPEPPTDTQLRDLRPGPSGDAVEAQWLRALIAGTPLEWWEKRLDLKPAKIVGARIGSADDVVVGWSQAATAQRNPVWAKALLGRHLTPELVSLAGVEAVTEQLGSILKREMSALGQSQLLAALPAPWTPELSAKLIHWARGHKHPAGVIAHHGEVFARSLDGGAGPMVKAWLSKVSKNDDAQLHRGLRTILQCLTTRTSITEAFS